MGASVSSSRCSRVGEWFFGILGFLGLVNFFFLLGARMGIYQLHRTWYHQAAGASREWMTTHGHLVNQYHHPMGLLVLLVLSLLCLGVAALFRRVRRLSSSDPKSSSCCGSCK